MSKVMFDRLFKCLMRTCNESLGTKEKIQHSIGYPDVAEFKIFNVSFITMLT